MAFKLEAGTGSAFLTYKLPEVPLGIPHRACQGKIRIDKLKLSGRILDAPALEVYK